MPTTAQVPPTNAPPEQRLLVVAGSGPDAKGLTFLRNAETSGRVGTTIKAIPGLQPFKHNHYSNADFFRHDPETGTVRNAYGQRVVRVTEDFMVAVLAGLEDEVGEAAGEVLYRCGYEWGMQDMQSYLPRVQAEFEVEFSKMNINFMLETWWWPLTIEGWGTWRYDFSQSKQGLIFVDLFESVVAKSTGVIGEVVCYFYAGLFAAVFGVLAKKSLGGIEVQCYATGGDYCKFLISTNQRVNAAAFWRNEGASAKDILKKLKDVAE